MAPKDADGRSKKSIDDLLPKESRSGPDFRMPIFSKKEKEELRSIHNSNLGVQDQFEWEKQEHDADEEKEWEEERKRMEIYERQEKERKEKDFRNEEKKLEKIRK